MAIAPAPAHDLILAADPPETLVAAVEPLLTVREAAAVLRISERSLWGLTKRRQVRALKIGRAVRYDPRDLREYIDGAKI